MSTSSYDHPNPRVRQLLKEGKSLEQASTVILQESIARTGSARATGTAVLKAVARQQEHQETRPMDGQLAARTAEIMRENNWSHDQHGVNHDRAFTMALKEMENANAGMARIERGDLPLIWNGDIRKKMVKVIAQVVGFDFEPGEDQADEFSRDFLAAITPVLRQYQKDIPPAPTPGPQIARSSKP
jgi:hypothetical protein